MSIKRISCAEKNDFLKIEDNPDILEIEELTMNEGEIIDEIPFSITSIKIGVMFITSYNPKVNRHYMKKITSQSKIKSFFKRLPFNCVISSL